MSREVFKLAFPLAIVGIIAASTADGFGTLISIIIVVGMIYSLFHSAKGFERADRRRNRY